MKNINATYLFFYISFLIVIYTAIFLDKIVLVYIKPIVPLSLIILYITNVKKINLFFPLSMLVIATTDAFNYFDFVTYFDYIAVLISVFYVLCVLLLKDYVAKDDIKFSKLTSLPVIVSIILIGYLIFSITELTLPKVQDSLGFIVLIVLSLLLFVVVCFFIYEAQRFEKSIYLFVASCCTLFVDALLAINELYYYNRVFTILINITEIAGIYFFTIFFIETKFKKLESFDKQYF